MYEQVLSKDNLQELTDKEKDTLISVLDEKIKSGRSYYMYEISHLFNQAMKRSSSYQAAIKKREAPISKIKSKDNLPKLRRPPFSLEREKKILEKCLKDKPGYKELDCQYIIEEALLTEEKYADQVVLDMETTLNKEIKALKEEEDIKNVFWLLEENNYYLNFSVNDNKINDYLGEKVSMQIDWEKIKEECNEWREIDELNHRFSTVNRRNKNLIVLTANLLETNKYEAQVCLLFEEKVAKESQ